MVAVMTMTPVHMRDHGHTLGEVGFVIGLHIAAMFLPSPITGLLVDRVGRMPMVVASGVTLLAAGVVESSRARELDGAADAGAGTARSWLELRADQRHCTGRGRHATRSRARTQGALDVLVALAGAGGGALSGWVVAGTRFATLALGGGLLALLLVPVVAWSTAVTRRSA